MSAGVYNSLEEIWSVLALAGEWVAQGGTRTVPAV